MDMPVRVSRQPSATQWRPWQVARLGLSAGSSSMPDPVRGSQCDLQGQSGQPT